MITLTKFTDDLVRSALEIVEQEKVDDVEEVKKVDSLQQGSADL